MRRGTPPRRRRLSWFRTIEDDLRGVGCREWGMGSREWGVRKKILFPYSPLPTPHSPLPILLQFEGLLNFASSISTLFLTSVNFVTMVIAGVTRFQMWGILTPSTTLYSSK